MSKPDYYILMADIIGSRRSNQAQLMKGFKAITSQVQRKNSRKFLSPITITLGDEFQSVLENLGNTLQIVLQIEEEIIRQGTGFKLRYTVVQGKIETNINHKTGYGMLGEGLTLARETLSKLKDGKNRFIFDLKDAALSKALNEIFMICQDYIDNWNVERDYSLVTDFLDQKDYKDVADKMGKTRSLIWKRKKSLKIEQYIAVKQLIAFIGGFDYE